MQGVSACSPNVVRRSTVFHRVLSDRDKTFFRGWTEVADDIATRGHCSFMKLPQEDDKNLL